MFEYFSEIKSKDEVAKKRFVIIGTTISFIAIIAIWVPIRIAQWKMPSDATLAKTEELSPATASPEVAGDSVIRIFTNVASPKPTASPFSTTPTSLLSVPPTSATPVAESLFTSETSVTDTVPEATPSATDFPTL